MKSIYYLVLITLMNSGISTAQTIYDQTIEGVTTSGERGEAHIVINPYDSSKMVIGYMDMSQNGMSFKIYHSSDYGNTWVASTLNTAARLSLDYPQYEDIGGGDIIFAYDKDGTLYCSWIYLVANMSAPNPADSCIWTSYWAKSFDNGQTFEYENGNDHFFARGKLNANTMTVLDYEEGVCDRQWMDVDLSDGPNANRLYIGYINYPFNIQETGLKVKSKLPNETAFSPQVMAYSGAGQLTNISIDNNGLLHYTFCDIDNNNIYHISSNDGGQTFSAPHLIADVFLVFPESNFLLNDRENTAPTLAIDGNNNLYITWNDFPTGTFPTAHYSKSTDGGVTWSAPVDLTTLFGKPVFQPVVSCSGSRVTFGGYGLEGDKKADFYIVTSDDEGAIFDIPLRMSSGVTDFAEIGISHFFGDYSTSVRTHCTIYNTWTDCRSGCQQYISKYDECASVGVYEISPVETTYNLTTGYEPVQDILTLYITSSLQDQLSVEIYSLDGKKIMVRTENIYEGSTKINCPLKDFSNGKYLVCVRNKNGIMTTKLVDKL